MRPIDQSHPDCVHMRVKVSHCHFLTSTRFLLAKNNIRHTVLTCDVLLWSSRPHFQPSLKLVKVSIYRREKIYIFCIFEIKKKVKRTI